MIRTLQLAGVHGWVSLRLTVSRGYWLPRLSMAFIAGYCLLFFVRHYNSMDNPIGLVIASFYVGLSCLSLVNAEGIGRTLPLPLSPRWLTAVNVLTQVTVCVAIAFGFMLVDVATSFAAASSFMGGDWAAVLGQPVSHLLGAEELKDMAVAVLGAIPIGLAAVRFSAHFQQPENQLFNRRWQTVLPQAYGITIGLWLVTQGLSALNVSRFAEQYMYGWLAMAVIFTAVATSVFAWIAVFPPSKEQARLAQPAEQGFRTTLWRSQAIKWSIFTTALVLYMTNPGSYLPDDWWIGRLRGRPLYSAFAVFLPFFSILMNSGSHSSAGRVRLFSNMWSWRRSGWQMVPVRRATIQRGLMMDILGYATVSTIGLHTALILCAQATTRDVDQYPWVQDLAQFTWFFTGFIGLTLPLFLLLFIPRRRFGLGLSIVALIAAFWGVRNAIFFVLAWDVSGVLTLKQHLITVVAWAGLAAVMWVQTGSPTGRLFERGAPANRWSEVVAALIGARGTRWAVGGLISISVLVTIVVHRNAISTEMDRRRAVRITPEQTDRLIEDLKRADALGVLRTTTRSRDAGSILNPYIGLDDGTPAEVEPWWGNTEHKYKFKRLGSPWFDVPHDVDLEVGDLSILTQLMEYDHWETARLPTKNQSGVGPYEAHLRTVRERTYLHWGGPFPNLVSLIDLAKIRLLHGLRTDDVLPALQEVRHLAKLVYSDETLISTLLAVGILRNEQRVYAAAVQRGMLEADEWVAISEDDINRMHRAAVSLDYMMRGGADEAQWRRIAELPFEPFGLCGAIHDSMTMAMSHPVISFWPGELFPVPEMRFVSQALADHECSIPLARHDHRAYTKDSPLNSLFRNRSWHQLLAKEFGENTMLKLTIPYLRGQAWMDIEEGQNMGTILMYGEHAEDDWRGPAWKREQR